MRKRSDKWFGCNHCIITINDDEGEDEEEEEEEEEEDTYDNTADDDHDNGGVHSNGAERNDNSDINAVGNNEFSYRSLHCTFYCHCHYKHHHV